MYSMYVNIHNCTKVLGVCSGGDCFTDVRVSVTPITRGTPAQIFWEVCFLFHRALAFVLAMTLTYALNYEGNFDQICLKTS